MSKVICPRCKNDLKYDGKDNKGNVYFYCDEPHTWFQKFLKLIRLKKNWR